MALRNQSARPVTSRVSASQERDSPRRLGQPSATCNVFESESLAVGPQLTKVLWSPLLAHPVEQRVGLELDRPTAKEAARYCARDRQSPQRANGLRNPGCTGRSQQDRVVVQLRYFVDSQQWKSAAPARQLLLGIQTRRLVKQPAR